MVKYENLNIYEASFEEVKEAVKEQYRNREHEDYYGRTVFVKDWNEINRNIRSDLKRMGVRFQTAFYNPNNERVYIKQKFWKETLDGIEFEFNSSEDYEVATGMDVYYTEEDYFTVPAW